MNSGKLQKISLRDLLHNPSEQSWREIQERIINNHSSSRLIINCTGVNPNDLNPQQRYYLFYQPQQTNWQCLDYARVFQNRSPDLDDFLLQVSNREITIEKPLSATVEISKERSDTIEPPQLIGNRYQIMRKLGEGAFGETYLARDLHKPGQSNCVVKGLKPFKSEGGTISKAERLFAQEAEILDRLEHHCIPRLFAYFAENQRFYLVQEYIQGQTLDKIIPGSQPWTREEVIKLLKDILEPLAYLHQQNIIHRDLKPANLIRRHGDNKIVLIDFGAIKQVTEQANQPGTVIGTIGYMPIEQQQGNPVFASDLYAVGRIVIQAATGRKLNELTTTANRLIWEDQATNLDSPLKRLINKLTKWNHQERYPSAQEALEALELLTTPPTPPTPPGRSWRKIILAISSVVALAAIGLGVKSVPYFSKPKLSIDTITIGHLGDSEKYLELSNHLEEGLVPANYWDFLKGKKINVIIEGDRSLSYTEARKRIAKRKWDIAFTLSPINSIWAIDHDYTYLAAMFPKSTHYEGGIFVRKDSPIQSIDDLGPTTVIALGGFNSASSFYLPAYALYGKTVSVDLDNRGPDIISKVKRGEVDAGAAAIGDSVRKDDPELRIIHVSSAIPGSGVYLSPDLSPGDRRSLSLVMLNASDEIKEKANYGGDAPEPDYTEFRKIMARVEEILVCSDFSKNPVNFFCPENTQLSQIRVRVNGVTVTNNGYSLKAVDSDHQIYTITLDQDVFEAIVGSDQLTDIHNKNLAITIPGEPIPTKAGLYIPITQAQQLQIVD